MQIVPRSPEFSSGHDITTILKSSFARNKRSYTPCKRLFLLLTYIVTKTAVHCKVNTATITGTQHNDQTEYTRPNPAEKSMHTPDPYHGTGSMIDAAEIPVKQYNAMGGFGGSSTTDFNQHRPMNTNTSHRRSSSGVYDDEDLASSAAMAALYKQDLGTAGQNSMTMNSPQPGNLIKESGAEESSGHNGNGMSSPRQRLNGKLHIRTSPRHRYHSRWFHTNNTAVYGAQQKISPDAGGFHFPKTLRRQPQQEENNEPAPRPHIPLHQRSLRRSSGQDNTSSTTSYMKLSARGQLPSPGRLLSDQVHMIPQPEATGPAGAKTMRHHDTMEENPGRETAVNLPPPQGASAAGLMTDHGNDFNQPNPADIPATMTTTPSGVRHGAKKLPPRPTNTMGGHTTEAQNLNTQTSTNPYMPAPENQILQNMQHMSIQEGEGAFISKKTLRHPADEPKPKQQAGEMPPPPKVPLASKTLRRPSSSDGKTGKTGLLNKLRSTMSQRRQSQSQQQQSYQGEPAAMRVDQGVDTTVHETTNRAITHEHITPVIRNEQQEVIEKDIHNYDVYDRILPVKEHIDLPARHYTPDASGRLHEMKPEGYNAAGEMQISNGQQRILVSETKVTSPGGTTRTESVWRYPTAGENVTTGNYGSLPLHHTYKGDWSESNPVIASNSTMQTNTNNLSENVETINTTANAKPAPSAATSSRPDTVRTFSRTPRDGDVLVSQPLHSLDSPPGATPIGGHNSLEYSGPISGMHAGTQAGLNMPDVPPKSPKRTLSAAARAAKGATAVGSPTAASQGMSQSPSGGQGVMGAVTMGGASTAPGIPPPMQKTHQDVHATGRNDLGPTHHTDIDQRRADTHVDYAGGMDSEAYMGPGYHLATGMDSEGLSHKINNPEARAAVRRPSVSSEWGAISKPRRLKHDRDEQSPIGARPARPTPSPQRTMRNRSRDNGPTLRQRLSHRLHSTGEHINTKTTNDVSRMSAGAQHIIQQRMPSTSQVRTTSQRFVPTRGTVKNTTSSMPSTEQMKSTASKVSTRATQSIPSSEALKHAAIETEKRAANSMPETTKAAQQMRQQSNMAAAFAGNVTSSLAEGVRKLMPEHLTTEVHTPHPPGAFEDSGTDQYTHSDEYYSQRDSVSSDSSLSSPIEKDMDPNLKRLTSVGGAAPTIKEMENMVVPGGVIQGCHALVGPAVLMENKKVEEEMSLKRLRRLSAHEHDAVALLSEGNGKISKGVRTNHRENKQKSQPGVRFEPTKFEREQSMASKMKELRDAETEREKAQSERIQQTVEKNFLREEHDEFERAKQVRREADRALQQAKRTKLPEDIDLAHKLEKEYQSSMKQNQKVLKENYRSGLGVIVGHGQWETTKHHSGRFDGVERGTGPSGFSPTHTTFPTGFEKDGYLESGVMSEGTESENPWNYNPPSNNGPNHPLNRPKNLPRRTTGNVVANHSVFPNPEIESSSLRKSKTISTLSQPSTRETPQRTISQRFVKPASVKAATNNEPTIMATQLAEGSHSVLHPARMNIQQHMTLPVNGNPHTPTNALELDPITAYTQPIQHPADLGQHTQAIPIDPSSHKISKDPIHPHTSMNIPLHQKPQPVKTAPVRHPLTREGSQALPIGPFPTLTQQIGEVDGKPTQAVPIDPLTHTIPKDPLHFTDAVVSPLNPLALSPKGEEKDKVLTKSPTDPALISSTMDTLGSPGEITAGTAGMSKSAKKKLKRKQKEQEKRQLEKMSTVEADRLGIQLLSRDTPSPMPAEAQAKMDRAMKSPLPIKEPAGIARPGASTVVGGVKPMSWSEVAKQGELEHMVDDGEVKLLGGK